MGLESLMSFGGSEERPFADMVLGHVPFAELNAMLRERYSVEDDDDLPVPSRLRYDYCIFADNESAELNASPSDPKAKAVTVAYHRWVPPQDGSEAIEA